MNLNVETPGERELRRAKAHLAVVAELSQSLNSALTFGDLGELLRYKLAALFPIDTLGLAVYSPKTETLLSLYHVVNGKRRPGVAQVPVAGTLSGWMLENRQTLLIGDVRMEIGRYLPAERCQIYLASVSFLSALYVPLFDGERLMGILTIQCRVADAYTPADGAFLESLRGFFSLAMINARSRRKIHRLQQQIHLPK